MSFSSPSGGGGGDPSAATHASTAATSHDNFGQIFSHILEQKYPMAGGLAHMVFGGGNASPQSSAGTPPGYGGMATAPLPQMPTGETQQPDIISQNAKPPSGGSGGLGALLSLFL